MRIGDVLVDPLIDGEIAMDPKIEYPNMPESAYGPYREFLFGGERFINTLGGYLIRSADRVIVVDAGVGRDPAQPWRGGAFRSSFLSYGLTFEDVTDVVFTHLHTDHIGWASLDGVPTFANAVYRCDARDWAFYCSGSYQPPQWEIEWSNPGDHAEARLAPVADRLATWNGSAEILPGLEAIDAPGHTPGHCVLLVRSDGEQGMLLGDLVHTQPEILADAWEGVADLDPVRARASRAAVRGRLEAESIPFAAAHFPGLMWGRIERRAGARHWIPLRPEVSVRTAGGRSDGSA